ncbi:MAG TPA: lipocalin family protein [Chitinophagaceae bacterium]|jgi:hypothetical protein|nr:lipocalin family protein [Chitinophagaceae bacterium]
MKTTMIVLLACFSLLIISCGNTKGGNKESKPSENKADKASPLEGAWEIKRAEGQMADQNVGVVYEFKGNDLTFGQGSFKNPGKTIITDSTFSFQADGNELKFSYHYSFKQDTLVVEMDNSGGQVFYMTKQ